MAEAKQRSGPVITVDCAALVSLIGAAAALTEAVTFDDSGAHGRGGNGGLLSRETIRKNDEMKLALSRFDASQPA